MKVTIKILFWVVLFGFIITLGLRIYCVITDDFEVFKISQDVMLGSLFLFFIRLILKSR